MKESVSIKSNKSSFDIIKRTFDPEYEGEWFGSVAQKQTFINIYIKEKYKDNLLFLPFVLIVTLYGKKKQGTGGGKNGDVVLVDYNTKNENYVRQINKKTVKNELTPYIKKYQNSKKRFHFFDITMHLWVSQEELHSVSALYDKQTNQVDFFNTTLLADLSLFNKRFQLFFKQIYGKDVKLNYSPECLKFGELKNICEWDFYKHSIDKKFLIDGACAIWTLWFLELRLKNKSFSREDIVDKALVMFKNKKDLVCKLLYDYGVFVDKITQQYNVKEDPETGRLVIEYKKSVKSNKMLKMILASLGIFLTSAMITKTIYKNRKSK